jgi:hypothetical protein
VAIYPKSYCNYSSSPVHFTLSDFIIWSKCDLHKSQRSSLFSILKWPLTLLGPYIFLGTSFLYLPNLQRGSDWLTYSLSFFTSYWSETTSNECRIRSRSIRVPQSNRAITQCLRDTSLCHDDGDVLHFKTNARIVSWKSPLQFPPQFFPVHRIHIPEKITLWSRVLLQKFIVTQLVKKFPLFMERRRFITVLTRARQRIRVIPRPCIIIRNILSSTVNSG